MLPELDSRGLLPSGVHQATLAEVGAAFATSPHRQQIFSGLGLVLPILRGIFTQGGCACRPLMLAGSYFSDKVLPDDIECTVVLDASTPPAVIGTFAITHSQAHAFWKQTYRVDFWPTLPGNSDFSKFFQYVGLKTAAAKGLNAKDLRGIVEVSPW